MRPNRLSMIGLILLIVILLPMAAYSKTAAMPIKETQIKAWTGAAWTTVTTGWMRTPTLLAATVTGLATLNGGATFDGGATTIADTTGAIATSSTISGRHIWNTVISAGTVTLAVATTPSESVIPCTAATVAVTLPAVATSAGVSYKIVMKGATQITITGATACVLSNGTAVKTNIVYTTTVLNSWYSLECDGTNWYVNAKAAPDSSS